MKILSTSVGAAYGAFNRATWRKVCEAAAAASRERSAQSHHVYVELLSSSIDKAISMAWSAEEIEQALGIAIDWGYASRAERAMATLAA